MGWGQSRKIETQLEGKARASTSNHGSEPATPPCGSARGSASGIAAERHATEVKANRGG